MDTEQIIQLMEELGFCYEEGQDMFWHIESESFFDLPKDHCTDLSSVMILAVAFEKDGCVPSKNCF